MSDVSIACVSSCLGVTPMSEESLRSVLAHDPDALVADAGTADVGAQYLGTGVHLAPREWERGDLRLLLVAARARKIPLIIGSVGGAGTDAAVDALLEDVRRIAEEEGLPPFTLAGIRTEVDREWLVTRAKAGAVSGLGIREPLTADVIRDTDRVVAMAGVEPFLACLESGVDVIIAGRSCDVALFAALPIHRGKGWGPSVHMGKSIECGSLAAEPVISREPVIGIVRDRDFLVGSCHPDQRATPASVSAFQLYERSDPLREDLPGGYADLASASFHAHSSSSCRVEGSAWVEAPYRVKLEGAQFVGERAIVIFGLRDPDSLNNLDEIEAHFRKRIDAQFPDFRATGGQVRFHVYGRDGVLQARETATMRAHEVGIVVDIVHRDEDALDHVANLARYLAFRADYAGKASSGGTGAVMVDEYLRAPNPVYRWSIDHLLTVSDWRDLASIRVERVGEHDSAPRPLTRRAWEVAV